MNNLRKSESQIGWMNSSNCGLPVLTYSPSSALQRRNSVTNQSLNKRYPFIQKIQNIWKSFLNCFQTIFAHFLKKQNSVDEYKI
jgi:hypothetical protein